MPAINIIETIHLIHEAQFLMTKIPKDQRPELQAHIDAVISIAAIYLRIPNPEVTPDKKACIDGLTKHMNQLKENAWQTHPN